MSDAANSVSDPNIEYLSAMQTVMQVAEDRVGNLAEFDCLVAFLTWEVILDTDSKYEGSIFLMHEEQAIRFREHYSASEDARLGLITTVLERSLEDQVDEAVARLASKIVSRMQVRNADRSFARPLLYVTTAIDGIAVALATYADFWTEEW